jgi:hypothetical protein
MPNKYETLSKLKGVCVVNVRDFLNNRKLSASERDPKLDDIENLISDLFRESGAYHPSANQYDVSFLIVKK